MRNPIKTHIFTDVAKQMFLKQAPGQNPLVGNVSLTFGLVIPEDTDVLIVFNRASYSLETTLPKARTAFVAAEPDVIHPYSRRFLDQFGLVLTTTPKPLNTEKWQRSTCWYWFAGVNFSTTGNAPPLRDHDWFSALDIPQKSDKISIVTSTKVHTEFHRKRMRLVETLIAKIPDHLEIYGRGFKSIDDKADAMLPCRYHLAIENGDGPHSWTEKLVDPWLCWAFPFYAGCDNVQDYFPSQSFEYLDLEKPDRKRAYGSRNPERPLGNCNAGDHRGSATRAGSTQSDGPDRRAGHCCCAGSFTQPVAKAALYLVRAFPFARKRFPWQPTGMGL